jgi:riboflavin kinase/FMN adenylyltransferase
MEIYRGQAQAPPRAPCVLTLGVFDGVHLGHQAVLREAVALARALECPAGIVTFGQHPRGLLEGRAPDFVTTLEHRLHLFARAGADFTWVLDFTPELSRLAAEQFARSFLVERLALRVLVLGFDSRFGHDRVGPSSPELAGIGQKLGFEIRIIPPVLTRAGLAISSSLIREAILGGRLREAEELLGRRVSVLGQVARGQARGRRLGYATANLDLGREVRPPFGVYATLAELRGRKYGSVTNVGYRPTVAPPTAAGQKPDLLVETHLFDFQGDLYGEWLEVHFIEKLRDERRFSDVEALTEQIGRDEAQARKLLEAQGLCH